MIFTFTVRVDLEHYRICRKCKYDKGTCIQEHINGIQKWICISYNIYIYIYNVIVIVIAIVIIIVMIIWGVLSSHPGT